jgi:chromosome segregation ATPase
MADKALVTLQVCIRCRPFAKNDKLGVLITNGKDGTNGDEVELLSEEGDRFGRWGFSKAWWSAYNYEKFTDPASIEKVKAAGLTSVSQEAVYNQVGDKMKQQFMDGNAVVLFAYGLSGSGKTYSVFGPDMIGMPEAWFNFERPHQDWGVFPRLAYDIITNEQSKAKGHGQWELSIKYFQNVVDRILDLLTGDGDDEDDKEETHHRRYNTNQHSRGPSPGKDRNKKSSGMVDGVEDRHINEGFHVDSHGFVDITWCRRHVLKSWEELTTTFKKANAKKAIAPTQFNPASTRGHCILVFEAKMPHPTLNGVSRCGRLYVCDLAGAEPAAEVHCAQYSRSQDDQGRVQYEYRGRHPDQKKTDELVKQGKKINLSLSEMTGFFRQMAKLIKRKKFNPSRPIPGCRTYFLGKFLKNTLMHAQTYLFAAIRPELQYQTFTESTLEFANHASVVKLRPKRMDSHQVNHDSLPGNATHDHGLFSVENRPASLHEKLELLHGQISGRRALSTAHQTKIITIIEHASDFLSNAKVDALKKLVEKEDSNALSAAAVLNACRQYIFEKSETSGQVSDSFVASLNRETQSAHEDLKRGNLTLEERANFITHMEEKTDELAKEHSNNMDERIRRGSVMTLHRTGSLLFDLDHRNTSVAHAIMLCSSQAAFKAVLARQDMPPTMDDDIYLEEAGLSGNFYIDMVLQLLSQHVNYRVKEHDTVSSAQLETEMKHAATLQTSLDQAVIQIENLLLTQEETKRKFESKEKEIGEMRTSMSLKEEQVKIELDLAKNELEVTDQNAKIDMNTMRSKLAKVKQQAKSDLDSARELAKKELELTKQKAKNELDDAKKTILSTKTELKRATSAAEEAMHEVLKGNMALDEAETLRASQVVALTNQVDAMRAKMEKMREDTSILQNEHFHEMTSLKEEASKEKQLAEKLTDNLRSKLAKFAARAWKSNAKSQSMVRKTSTSLMKAQHDNEDLHHTLETLHEGQKHKLKLAREQNIAHDETIVLLKQRNTHLVVELDELKSSHMETLSEHRVELANVEHAQRSLEFQLQEQQAAAERSSTLEKIKVEEMDQDRTTAETSLEEVSIQVATLEKELDEMRDNTTTSEHTFKVKVADLQAQKLQANEETKAAKRRLATSLDQSKRLTAAKDEQRQLIIELESKLVNSELVCKKASDTLRTRRASALEKDEEEELKKRLKNGEEQVEKMRSAIKDHMEESQKWETQCRQIKKELSLVQLQLQESESVAKSSIEKYTASSTELDSLREQCDEFETKFQQATRRARAAESRIEEADVSTSRRVLSAESQLSKAREELKILENQKIKNNSEIEELKKASQEWELKCQEEERKGTSLAALLEDAEKDATNIHQTAEESMVMLRKQLEVAEEARNTQVKMVQDSLEKSEATSFSTIAALREDIRKERETLREARTTLNQQRLDDLSAQRKLEEEMSSIRLSLREKETMIGGLIREKDSAAQENQNMQKLQHSNSELVRQLQQRCDDAREALSTLRQEKTKKETEHSNTISTLTTERDESMHRISSLTVELDRERQINSVTRQQLDEARDTQRISIDEARSLATKLNEVVDANKNSSASMKVLNEEIRALKAKDTKVASDTRQQLARGAKSIANYEAKRKELSKAEEKIKLLQNALEESKTSTSMKRLKKLKTKIKEHKKATEDAHHSAQAALELAATHKETVEHHRDEHKEAHALATKAKSEANIARKALSGLRKKLATEKSRIQMLEAERIQIQQDHVTAVSKMQDKHGRLRNKLLAYQREVDQTKSLMSGNGAWQEVEKLKKELISSQNIHMVLELKVDEHENDSKSIKQSHSQLVEQYEQEISTLRQKLVSTDKQLRVNKMEAQTVITTLRKNVSTAKITVTAMETERDALTRRFQGEIEARKHDMLNMLQTAERTLHGIVTRGNGKSPVALTDSNPPLEVEESHDPEKMISSHLLLCERVSSVATGIVEEFMVAEQDCLRLKHGAILSKEEIQSLEVDMQRLRSDFNEKDHECQRLTILSRDTRQEVLKLNTVVEAEKADQRQREQQYTDSQAKIDELRQLHQEALRKKALEDETGNDSQRRQMEKLEADIRIKNKLILEIQVTRDSLLSRTKAIEKEKDRMLSELTGTQKQLNETKRTLKTRQEEIRTMEENTESLQNRLSDTEVRLQQTENMKSNVEQELGLGRRALEDTKRDLDSNTHDAKIKEGRWFKERTHLSSQIQQLRTESTRMSNEMANERARVSDSQSEIRSTEQRVEAAERRSESVEDELEGCRTTLKEVTEELANVRTELQKQVKQTDHTEKEYRTTMSQMIKETRNNERESKKESKRTCDKLIRAEERVREVNEKNEEIRKRSENDLRTARENLQETIQTATSELTTQVESLESEKLVLEEDATKLRENCAHLRGTVTDYENKLSVVKSKVSTLSEEKNQMEVEMNELHLELHQANDRVNDVEAAVRTLDEERERAVLEKEKILSMGALERNSLVLELSHLRDTHVASLGTFETKHTSAIHGNEILSERNAALETKIVSFNLERERLEREKVAYVEVSGRQKLLLSKMKSEMDNSDRLLREELFDVQSELAETVAKMTLAEDNNLVHMDQVKSMRNKLENARDEVKMTRTRLDKFRSSYRVAQEYLNGSNTKIEQLTENIMLLEAQHEEAQKDADDVESRLREELVESETKVIELEPQARKNAMLIDRNEDLQERLADSINALNQEYEARSSMATSLSMLVSNEQDHLDSVNHCQSMLDAIEREIAREAASNIMYQSKGSRTLRSNKTPKTPGTESFLRKGEGHLSGMVLTTPRLSSSASSDQMLEDDHVHTPGHRHCPTCEAKRTELESRVNEKGGHSGSHGSDNEGISNATIRKQRRRRKIPVALFKKAQRVAVELSAAIQLLERSFQRFRANKKQQKREKEGKYY